MKGKSKYLIVISMAGLIYSMEKVAITLFLFPHLVDDINPQSAQRNFTIAQVIYWLLSMVMDLVAGKFAEKTGYSHQAIGIAVACKVLYLYIYVFTKNVSLLMSCITLAGFSNYLYPLCAAELNKYTSDEETGWWLNFIMTVNAIGGVMASIIRIFPTGFKIEICFFTITQGSICMFIVATLYLIYLPFFGFMKPSDPLIKERESSDNIYTGDRRMKVFAIVAHFFCATLVWDTSTLSCVEVAKHIGVSDFIVSVYFIVRFIVCGLSNVLWSRKLADSSSTTLMLFLTGRQAAVAVMFISALLPTSFATFALLLCSDMMLSILYFFDISVLLGELWRLSKGDSTTLTAVAYVGRNLGYVFGCLVPLCFNFIEFVYALILITLVITQLLHMKTSLIQTHLFYYSPMPNK